MGNQTFIAVMLASTLSCAITTLGIRHQPVRGMGAGKHGLLHEFRRRRACFCIVHAHHPQILRDARPVARVEDLTRLWKVSDLSATAAKEVAHI
jgi:hypothetical protein